MTMLGAICLTAPLSATAQEFRFNSGGGPINLIVQSATAGSEPTDASDSSSEIYWDAAFGLPSKITVSTISPGQSFRLYIRLSVPSQGAGGQGIVQPEVQLQDGMLDMDLFTDIPSTLPGRQGFGTLIYRAAAAVAEGNSNEHLDDTHLVTFTILAQ
ncbi:hypothetical protein HQ496_06135 [bacterium]|nr:hypothetical protein [bacterium]